MKEKDNRTLPLTPQNPPLPNQPSFSPSRYISIFSYHYILTHATNPSPNAKTLPTYIQTESSLPPQKT